MNKQIERNDVPMNEKWNLTHIYKNLMNWETDYSYISSKLEELSSFNQKLNTSEALVNYLILEEDVSYKFEKLVVYARMQQDEDTTQTSSQELVEKVDSLGTLLSEANSYFSPQFIGIGKERVLELIKEEPKLKYFEKDLLELFKYENHVLSEEKEELLSQIGEVFSVPSKTFGMINNADMKFGNVIDAEGIEQELTRGLYSKLLESSNRDIRKTVYKTYQKEYVRLKNTLASSLGANIKNNVLISKVYNYPSALEQSLFHDDVPLDVYTNLIETTKKNNGHIAKYTQMRKNVLGLEKLHVYDMSVPLVKDFKYELPYDEAYELVKKGLEPLGEDYQALLNEAKKGGWIDVRETSGKRSGAYSWGPYGTHPYVLLNHQDDLDSMFTLAHELGHAMHSHYSDTHQPANQAQYTIFVAEVASTVNEILLMKHLLATTEDPDFKKYLLNHFIEQFIGTLFTQVMFAEFEKVTHEMAAKGESLTADSLSQLYEKLYREYNGEVLTLDEELKYGWSRIPHFYTPFYVYKYATGYSAATAIVKMILEEGTPALERYKTFLKSGGSDTPIELLKKAGVDLSTSKPIEDALVIFNEIVEEFCTLFQEHS